jgi:hypothetical protein
MANEIARSHRKRMTPQEVKLWVHHLVGVLTLIDDALRNPPPGLALLGHPPPTGEGSS